MSKKTITLELHGRVIEFCVYGAPAEGKAQLKRKLRSAKAAEEKARKALYAAQAKSTRLEDELFILENKVTIDQSRTTTGPNNAEFLLTHLLLHEDTGKIFAFGTKLSKKTGRPVANWGYTNLRRVSDNEWYIV